MESKKLKKALECCAIHDCSDSCIFSEKHPFACLTEMHKQLLTLINDLESENAKLNIELDKRDRIDYPCRLIEKEHLKQFAERLKEKFNDTEYRAKTKRKTISIEKLKAQMDWILHEVVVKNIDETLKEFEYGQSKSKEN